jgi:hypothetical protein
MAARLEIVEERILTSYLSKIVKVVGSGANFKRLVESVCFVKVSENVREGMQTQLTLSTRSDCGEGTVAR